MAKKNAEEKKEESESFWKQMASSFGQIAKAASVTASIKQEVQKTKKKIEKEVISGILIGAGFIFILFAAIQLLKDFYGVSYGVSLMFLGIVAIITGLIVKH
ncbi:MAG: hypothetical protein ACMXYK_00010 [Candidatus Woesearchaeota archaeon]